MRRMWTPPWREKFSPMRSVYATVLVAFATWDRIVVNLKELLNTQYLHAHIGLGKESQRQMGICVTVFSRWLGHEAELSDLTDQSLRAFLSDYSKTAAPSTVNSKRRQLLALWRFAWEESLVRDIYRKVRRMSESIDPPEAWTLPEVEVLIRTASRRKGRVAALPAGAWWASILSVAYETGQRISAILAVRIMDVNWPRSMVLFRSGSDKTNRGHVLPISPPTMFLIARIFEGDRELLWPWPMSREWLDKSFRQIAEEAGLDCGRGRGGLFHKLRRTSGSLVEASGGDGARHLGNTRAVFEKHYRDPRICDGSEFKFLPRTTLNL